MACAIAGLHAARDLEANRRVPEGSEACCACYHCVGACGCDEDEDG